MSIQISEDSLKLINEHAITIYRHRDCESKELDGHWTVVNEDHKSRYGGIGASLDEAIQKAFER